MWVVILCAIFGGLAGNVLRLADLINRPKEERPDFKDPLYMLQFIILPLVGGGLAFVYLASGISLTPIVAVNIGASAPLVLKSFANTIPNLDNRRID